MSNPHGNTHGNARGAAMGHIHAFAGKHGVDASKHDQAIQSVLDSPAVARVFTLTDQIAANPHDSAAAVAEGGDLLRTTLVTVQGITQSVLDSAKAAGATPDPMAVRTAKAMEYALTGTMPS